jgi:hypothetical protein
MNGRPLARAGELVERAYAWPEAHEHTPHGEAVRLR